MSGAYRDRGASRTGKESGEKVGRSAPSPPSFYDLGDMLGQLKFVDPRSPAPVRAKKMRPDDVSFFSRFVQERERQAELERLTGSSSSSSSG
jgi:hypothetical protein